MFSLRRKNLLPFGPKLKNFEQIVKDKGLLAYHAEVYKKTENYKTILQKLYGERMEVYNMETIMTEKCEIKKMIDFTTLTITEDRLDNIFKTFDLDRVKLAKKNNSLDKTIQEYLKM